MKKRRNKLLGLFLLTIMLSTFLIGFVSATGESFFKSSFYETIKPYIVPDFEGYGQLGYGFNEFNSLIIGIISLIILLVIFFDILSLVPIFNRNTTRIIAIGLAIIMIVFKMNVWFASLLFAWGAVIFGWAGSLAVVGIIVLGILILIALFAGGGPIIDWLQNIRTARENAEKATKAKETGGDIYALGQKAKAANR